MVFLLYYYIDNSGIFQVSKCYFLENSSKVIVMRQIENALDFLGPRVEFVMNRI